ncbi:hypothetical protein [Flavobacterium sp. IMCC34518]|uniref:hypothetical protein n=1 Tax=Flavobacterium sp. IMCC34518 TaxID=3003623 RepID=UPI0022AC51E5|nr:hypothetical protein [Flavobacterium sp. IMCC34518]
MSKKEQKLEVQIQLQVKILSAIQTCFDKDSENYIDINQIEKDGNLNDLFHVLGTRVPQHIFSKITGQKPDPLEFNHICNKLIFQDREDTK